MRRNAFTLVELLVVILIIGLLVAITLPAVNAVRGRANKALDAVEINQLDTALKLFKEKYGAYPPDFADVDREKAMQQVRRFIRQAWPRCQRLPKDFQGTNLPSQYNAGTALPFWLGGCCDYQLNPATGRYVVEYCGFSADPTNPFDVDASGDPLATRSPSRVNAFYKFASDRFTGTPATLFGYWPKTMIDPTGVAGYVYFLPINRNYGPQTDASGNVVSGGKGFPDLAHGAMMDARNIVNGVVVGMPVLNPDLYQIRSCGRDGVFYGDLSGWGNKLGLADAYSVTADDMGNCWEGTLEDNF